MLLKHDVVNFPKDVLSLLYTHYEYDFLLLVHSNNLYLTTSYVKSEVTIPHPFNTTNKWPGFLKLSILHLVSETGISVLIRSKSPVWMLFLVLDQYRMSMSNWVFIQWVAISAIYRFLHYLSGVRSRFAYDPADAITNHYLLLQ